jgi:apolipoprotein N-acyltransferase
MSPPAFRGTRRDICFRRIISLLQMAAFVGLYGLTLHGSHLGHGAGAVVAWLAAAGGCHVSRPAAGSSCRLDRLSNLPTASDDALPKTVRIVQPAVPQHEKWDRTLRPGHLRTLTSLSRDEHPIPQLVIWPETAFAGRLDREEALLRETAWDVLPFDGWLITGVPAFRFRRTGCSTPLR